MPTDPPPAYSQAPANGAAPAVQVTHPEGDTVNASSDAINERPGHVRTASIASNASTAVSDVHDANLVDDAGRVDMDDERRDVPDGWVRCFDPKTKHHFYVDESTKRSTWLHPYDDPEYLRTLPETHPAHPNSVQAQNMRKRAEHEELMAKKMSQSDDKKGFNTDDGKHAQPGSKASGVDVGAKDEAEERNWFQRKKDKLIGTKEERATAKEEKRRVKAEREKKIREAQEAYLKRREELINQQLSKQRNFQTLYASDPYAYSPPTTAFSRSGGLYDSPYGYGYGGGYGRRYRPGIGYGTGYGMPLMLGGGAGLLGGMMMADAFSGPGLGGGFGGFDGGFGGGGFGGGGFDGGMGGGGGGFGC